ncbi:MAG: hypothetical protein ACM34I_12530 [bacterium]
MIKIICSLFLVFFSSALTFGADKFPSPDKTLIAVIEPHNKIKHKAEENVIKIVRTDGSILAQKDFRSADKEHGYIIDKIGWTNDSNFIVFSTYSSGGHQPWTSPTFFFARSDNKIRSIDDILGPVLDSDFEITSSDVLKIYVKDNKTGIDKVLAVRLSDLMRN